MFDTIQSALTDALQVLHFELFRVGGVPLTLGKLAIILFVVVVGRRLIRLLGHSVRNRLTRRGDPRAARGAASLVTSLAWMVLLMALLEFVGVGVSSVVTVFAALGIGIGLGLQGLINNVVSGFVLLLEQPLRPGDLIEVEDRVCEVVSVGWRATRVRDFNNVNLLVPNSKLLEENLINWTLTRGKIRNVVTFGVYYNSVPRQVEKVTLAVVAGCEGIAQEPAPLVQFMAFGESSLDFRIVYWIDDPNERVTTQSRLLFYLFDAFKEAGIEIPYPQRDVHILAPAQPGQG